MSEFSRRILALARYLSQGTFWTLRQQADLGRIILRGAFNNDPQPFYHHASDLDAAEELHAKAIAFVEADAALRRLFKHTGLIDEAVLPAVPLTLGLRLPRWLLDDIDEELHVILTAIALKAVRPWDTLLTRVLSRFAYISCVPDALTNRFAQRPMSDNNPDVARLLGVLKDQEVLAFVEERYGASEADRLRTATLRGLAAVGGEFRLGFKRAYGRSEFALYALGVIDGVKEPGLLQCVLTQLAPPVPDDRITRERVNKAKAKHREGRCLCVHSGASSPCSDESG
ncbi:MAG: hypothetical protein H6741_23345 [Alphaproteobacteria bacterium]|nr:hypothetical protein [Alphaproteobacteria bacterium]MCB9795644.1 hypothetical protein [Alphaproteobacteria bacterium]